MWVIECFIRIKVHIVKVIFGEFLFDSKAPVGLLAEGPTYSQVPGLLMNLAWLCIDDCVIFDNHAR